MRRFRFGLLFVVAAVALSGCQLPDDSPWVLGPNLLSGDTTNFGNSTGGWEPQGNTTLSRVAAGVTSKNPGSLAVKVDKSGPWPDSTRTARAGSPKGTKAIKATPGQSYIGALWTKSSKTTTRSRCELRFYNSNGAIVATNTDSKPENDSTTWRMRVCGGKTPSNASYVALRLFAENTDYGNTHWVDAAHIKTINAKTTNTTTTTKPPSTTQPPTTTTTLPPVPGDVNLTNFFPIGVDSQATHMFSTWKSRGVNTLIRVPQGHNVDTWINTANEMGFYQIRLPRSDAARDVNEKNLLAWAQHETPELNGTPASELRTEYNRLKALDPDRPVFLNFSGYTVLGWRGNCGESCYRSYISSSDWVSHDIYPVSGWGLPDDLGVVGRTIDLLRSWSGDRPQFAYIETSNWGHPYGTYRGPRPGEVRVQIWNAVNHGAKGIFYFPVVINPSWKFDGTPPDVAAEITKQNATLTALARVIQSPMNPNSMSVSASEGSLDIGWRTYNGKQYVFAVNLSSNSIDNARIQMSGIGSAAQATVRGESRSESISNGTIVDNFSSHELHIYEIG